MALPAVCSKVKGLLLFIHCLVLLPLFDGVYFSCFVVQYFVSFPVLQLSHWERESWSFYFCCADVILLCLFLKVLWVDMQCVSVTFPGHTHLLFGMTVICTSILFKYIQRLTIILTNVVLSLYIS